MAKNQVLDYLLYLKWVLKGHYTISSLGMSVKPCHGNFISHDYYIKNKIPFCLNYVSKVMHDHVIITVNYVKNTVE